ncbi:MAG: hypothetical protein PT942_03120 [Eubacteriales bacterium]|nr:hypothetical protein [Eubacteriales bacterium]
MLAKIYGWDVEFDENTRKVERISGGEGVHYEVVNLYKYEKACGAYVKQENYTIEQLKNCLYKDRGILR